MLCMPGSTFSVCLGWRNYGKKGDTEVDARGCLWAQRVTFLLLSSNTVTEGTCTREGLFDLQLQRCIRPSWQLVTGMATETGC